MKRMLLWLFSLILLLAGLRLFFPSRHASSVLGSLPLGWWHFLQRNVPQLTLSWSVIGMGLICSALVVVLGHGLLTALYAQRQRLKHPCEPLRSWRWRWTISSYLGVWLLFAIAFGAAGIFRHTIWLNEYSLPWYEERVSPYAEFRSASGMVETLLLENKADLKRTRRALRAAEFVWGKKEPLSDIFNVLFYAEASQEIAQYVIIPRQPNLLKHGKFFVSNETQWGAIKPLSELQHTITELEATYPLKGN